MMISGHRLLTANPGKAIDFYQSKLGMSLIAQRQFDGKDFHFLSFASNQDANLILVYDPKVLTLSVAEQPSLIEGYWKYSLSVPDVSLVRQRLVENNVMPGQCFEVPDIAYLCHLRDADGYCIELLQHELSKNFQPYTPDPDYILGCEPSINLSTLRVRDIEQSLQFYESLGMTLISRQQVPCYKMTLYFLSFDQHKPPCDDIDSLIIREWMWQRPYTLLELQHIHGTDKSPGFSYRTGIETGFLGLDMNLKSTKGLSITGEPIKSSFVTSQGIVNGVSVTDPDGYNIQLY